MKMTRSLFIAGLLGTAALSAQQAAPQPPSTTPQTAPQAPALTEEQVRAWLLLHGQPKQAPPATPTPSPAPTPPTAEQLALFEKWMQLQKQQAAVPAPPAQTAAQALAQYQSCIASEQTKLTNAANGQQVPTAIQNQINKTPAGVSNKPGVPFDWNAVLRQMQAAGIEAKATKNCKSLAPPAAPKP